MTPPETIIAELTLVDSVDGTFIYKLGGKMVAFAKYQVVHLADNQPVTGGGELTSAKALMLSRRVAANLSEELLPLCVDFEGGTRKRYPRSRPTRQILNRPHPLNRVSRTCASLARACCLLSSQSSMKCLNPSSSSRLPRSSLYWLSSSKAWTRRLPLLSSHSRKSSWRSSKTSVLTSKLREVASSAPTLSSQRRRRTRRRSPKSSTGSGPV